MVFCGKNTKNSYAKRTPIIFEKILSLPPQSGEGF